MSQRESQGETWGGRDRESTRLIMLLTTQVIAYRVLEKFTWPFGPDDSRFGDKDGHGTHVAGSIAGNSNLAPHLDGTGGKTMDHNGAAPHAKLIVESQIDKIPGLDPLRQRKIK